MLIDAFHAAFEDAVEALKRVCVNLAAAVFASAVIDIFMARKIIAQMRVLAGFVCHDRGFFRDVGAKDRHQMSGGRTFNMKAANLAAALDKRQDRVLVCIAAMLRHIPFLTDEGFINLDDPAAAAKWCKLTRAEGFTNAVRQKPRAVVLDAENAMKLVRTNALF
jgi:hypothetical protein